jgi:DNA replication and repair protein RecF
VSWRAPAAMIVTQLRLRHFRNHTASALEFGEGLNALLGDNGQGKTNILEAISYLGLTKSFYAASDARVVQFDEPAFEVDGVMRDAGGREHHVRVTYGPGPGEKTFTVNGLRPERLAAVIGRFPLVILSPDHGAITSGGPAERRKFLDITLAQVSPAYLEDLLEYRRVLRQRNLLLADGRRWGTLSLTALEPWTASLAVHAARVVARRRVFAAEFTSYVERAYQRLVPSGERPGLAYVGPVDAESVGETESALLKALERTAREEQQRGMTLVGPHRDDLRLLINGKDVQQFASQGQHKTLLVAFKIGEFRYVQERREESPVLLLDDVFSELDRPRAMRILELVEDLGQCVITATDEGVFHGALDWGKRHRRFLVQAGSARALEEAHA